jgi:hypothetical protein
VWAKYSIVTGRRQEPGTIGRARGCNYGSRHERRVMNEIGEGQIRAQEGRNSISDVWGDRTPYFGEDHWPERIDQRTTGAPDQWVQSACVLCSNGCALDIGVAGGPYGRRARPRH